MMRKMQQKEISEKKKTEKQTLIRLAEAELCEGPSEAVDEEEKERIRKRQAGTAVTEESFYEWKRKFDQEMNASLVADAPGSMAAGTGLLEDTSSPDESRPTGKQWFQMQTDKNYDDEEEEDDGGQQEASVEEAEGDDDGSENDDSDYDSSDLLDEDEEEGDDSSVDNESHEV